MGELSAYLGNAEAKGKELDRSELRAVTPPTPSSVEKQKPDRVRSSSQ